jgi:hypothetical protein
MLNASGPAEQAILIYFEPALTSSELNRNPSLFPVFIREN